MSGLGRLYEEASRLSDEELAGLVGYVGPRLLHAVLGRIEECYEERSPQGKLPSVARKNVLVRRALRGGTPEDVADGLRQLVADGMAPEECSAAVRHITPPAPHADYSRVERLLVELMDRAVYGSESGQPTDHPQEGGERDPVG